MKSKKKKKHILSGPLTIAGQKIALGERRRIDIDVGSLYDYTALTISVEVIRGTEPGPVLFVSAAIHGDEINGVEIVKRLLHKRVLKKIKGTLIAVPVVNVFGFNNKSRYLPDRRDLNRSFPGSSKGSLAGRLAHIFMKEIASKCTHGIDLHTGATNRTNLPQIRACLDEPETRELAKGFGVPVVIHSELRDGSLREAARKKGVHTLLFEGGEALRFEEPVIKAGLNGCLAVMKNIGMIPAEKASKIQPQNKVHIANETYWIRASHSGSFRAYVDAGDSVVEGDLLAKISNPFGDDTYEVRAEDAGIIIGKSQIPLVNKGDAMFHLALFNNTKKVKDSIRLFDDIVY